MTYSAAPYASQPYGGLPAGQDFSEPGAFQALLDNPDAQFILLMEAMPFDPDLEQSLTGWPLAFGSAPYSAPEMDWTGGETTIRLSDRGFITEPTDSPANTSYKGRLSGDRAYRASYTAFDGERPTGQGSTSFGEIAIQNHDAALDGYADYRWEGRPVVLKAGAEGFALSEFETVLKAVARSVRVDERQIVVEIEDRRGLLDRPIQNRLYKGTGGAEGDSDLEGRVVPLCYGIARQVRPVALVRSALVYQVHDGQIESVEAVRDQGIALTLDTAVGTGGDVSTYAALAAASIASSKYATCEALGLFRLGSSPNGEVTADIRGDAGSDGGRSGYVSRTADIVRRICSSRVPYLDDPIDYDLATFADVNGQFGGAVGIYIADAVTVLDVVTDLMARAGGYWIFTRAGRLALYQLRAAGGTGTELTQADNLLGLRRDVAPFPSWRHRVGFKPMRTVLSESEMAGGVPDADRQLFGNAFRFAEFSQSSVKGASRRARDVRHDTYLDVEADAEGEAERLQTLHGAARAVWEIPVPRALFRHWLGDTVSLDMDRYGLSDTKGVVIGVDEDPARDTTRLRVWV